MLDTRMKNPTTKTTAYKKPVPETVRVQMLLYSCCCCCCRSCYEQMQKRSCRHCRHVICLTQHRMLKRIKSLRSLRGCAATSKAKDARCQSQPLWCLWPIPNLQRSVTPITRDIKEMQHPICKRQALYGQVNANGYDGARQKKTSTPSLRKVNHPRKLGPPVAVLPP